MPCNSEYQNPTQYEAELVRVKSLLIELDKGREPSKAEVDAIGYYGYVPDRSNPCPNVRSMLDASTAELCAKCQSLGDGIKGYSLDLQIWWRDHQRHDADIEQAEADAIAKENHRQRALAKLCPSDRRALGLE